MPCCRGCLVAADLPAAAAGAAHRLAQAPARGTERAAGEGACGEGRGAGRRARDLDGPGEDTGAARGDGSWGWAWSSGWPGECSHGAGRRGHVTSRAREDPTWWSRRGDFGEHIDVSSGHGGGNDVNDSAALVAGLHVRSHRNKHSDQPRRGRCVHVSITQWWHWLWASGRLVFVFFFVLSCGVVGGSEGSAFGTSDNDTHLGQASTIQMKSYPSRIDRCLLIARSTLHVRPLRKSFLCGCSS
jgi:hypothetical protein